MSSGPLGSSLPPSQNAGTEPPRRLPFDNEKLRTPLVCLALVVGTLLIYWPVVTFDYVSLDDPIYLMNNFHVNGGFTWDGLKWCFTTDYASLWHPLTWLSLMLDCQIYHRWLGGIHLTNLVLHTVSSILLLLLLRRLTGAFWRSALVAAFFAWHPLHVESVAWISERKDVLCTVFWMLTLWAYVRFAEESRTPNPNGRPFYLMALVFFVLGLMAKPMLVTLPFVFLLLDWWPLRRLEIPLKEASPSTPGAARISVSQLLVEKIPFAVISAIFAIVTMHAAAVNTMSLAAFPFPHRLANAVVTCALYVVKTIVPAPLVVLCAYDVSWQPWQVFAAGLFLASISLLALRCRKSRPWLLFGWLWFLGTLVPVIGLVRVGAQIMADHHSYVPSIGLFVVFCWAASDLAGGWRIGPGILGGLACLALLVCGLLASRQVQYWRNDETLFTHDLAIEPDNFIAHVCYSTHWLAEHDLIQSRAQCEESLRLNPAYDLAHGLLSQICLQEGKFDEALDESAIAMQLNPTLNYYHLYHAKALLALNRAAEAKQELDALLADPPIPHEVHLALGRALAKLGRPDDACAQFLEALRLNPEYPDAHFQLSLALARQGKMTEAVAHYRLGKNLPAAAPETMVLNNLAWILAASPFPELRNGTNAVKLAERACALDNGRQPVFLGTLAAALAEAGRFDDAVTTAQQARALALKLAADTSDPAQKEAAATLAARNLELSEIYRSHQAFHEK